MDLSDAQDDKPLATWKRAAARAAAAEVPDGAIVGLGSGSTADLMVQELAQRVRAGLRVTGVPTSDHTRALAASLGIPLLDLSDAPILDLSIDGADEVTLPDLTLVKGRGGALLHEKLVAAASRRRVIIVDDSKLVTVLGSYRPVPVEIVPFGWAHTARRLADLGLRPVRRTAYAQGVPGAPFVTDGGNYILDCGAGPIEDAAGLAQAIKALVGVVEHGLFVGMTDRVIAAGPAGVQIYDRSA